MILVFGLEMGERFLRLLEYFLLPGKQLLPEIFPLALIHEWLFVGRPIAFGLVQDRCAIFVGRHCNPLRKHANPRSRGELISSCAAADNTGIAGRARSLHCDRTRQTQVSGRTCSSPPFMQQRRPVGAGPSSKTWPKCPPQRRQCTSVRGKNRERSTEVPMAFASGSQKLGQPVLLSNFVRGE